MFNSTVLERMTKVMEVYPENTVVQVATVFNPSGALQIAYVVATTKKEALNVIKSNIALSGIKFGDISAETLSDLEPHEIAAFFDPETNAVQNFALYTLVD